LTYFAILFYFAADGYLRSFVMSQGSSQPSQWLQVGTGVQFPAYHHTCICSGAHILEILWPARSRASFHEAVMLNCHQNLNLFSYLSK